MKNLGFLLLLYTFLYSACTNQPVCSKEEAKQAEDQGQWLAAAQIYDQCFQLNPQDEKTNYKAGTNYLRANQAQKALALFNDFDLPATDDNLEMGKREARIAKAYFQTEQYEKVLDAVKQYPYPKMYRGLAREEVKSLIRLNRFDRLAQQIVRYQKKGIYSEPEKKTDTDFLFLAICNELKLCNQDNILQQYANEFETWNSKQDENATTHVNHAFAKFYLQEYDEAVNHLAKAIAIEKAPRKLIELHMLLGVCYAEKGEVGNAKSQITTLFSIPDPPTRHDAFGIKHYYQARIETALEDKEAAIQSMKNALEQGAEFWSYRFQEDVFLKDLFELRAFKKMVRR